MLEEAAGAFRAAVDEESGGGAQRRAAEIIRDAVALDAIEKGGHLEQLGAHRDEAVVHDRPARSGGPGSGGRAGGALLGHDRSAGTKSNPRESRKANPAAGVRRKAQPVPAPAGT